MMEGKVSSSSYLGGELEEMCDSGKKTLWWCAVKSAMMIQVKVHKLLWSNVLHKYKLSHSQG
jgi:hypothetical protein